MIGFRELTEGISKPVPMSFVKKAMDSARSTVVGKPITPQNLAKAVEKALGRKFGVKTTLKYASALQGGDMSANAYYDQEDDLEGKRPVEVELLFSPLDKKGIDIDNEGFDDLSTEMAKVVVHELLHKHQAIKRGFVEPRPFTVKRVVDPKIQKAQEYLGKSDEIEAYGHNIALDLLRSYGSRKHALTALRNFVRIPPDKSPDMYAYLVAFGMDQNHSVLKKLVKKVILYLKELEK